MVIKPTYRFKDIAGVLKLYSLLKHNDSTPIDSLVESLRNLFKNINANPPCPKLNNDIMFFFKNIQKLFEDIYK